MRNLNLFKLCLLGVPVLTNNVSGQDPGRKPNIVLILADDMGWGDLNLNGNKFAETPVINRLAAQSLSFSRFYVCPLSAPTRSEMLTGRYFLRTGVSSVSQGYENMRSDEVTIAEVLKRNRYTTGCFGKWHNGGYFLQHPNQQGFDEFTGFCVGHLGYYYNALYTHNDGEIQSTGYSTDFFTEKAIDFIESNRRKPFFCYVAYNVPHSPFQVPEKYFNKYRQKGLDDELSSVYGMVENMDVNISLILSKLDRLSLRENTIVIFLSDNGPNTTRYNGDMKGKKGSVDEGGVHVPFYISWPGIIKSGITNQLAQDIDIFPTLLKLINIDYKPEKKIDGTDLSGVIMGTEKQGERYILSRQANIPLNTCNGSVRNDRYRLVITTKDTTLYDLINDPSQREDISEREKSTGILLTEQYLKWQTDIFNDYKPVSAIEAGFPEERKFTLPVQDATLSGRIRFSSIFPNQANTENWIQDGDSIFWNVNINSPAIYRVEVQYGCSASDTGSNLLFRSKSGSIPFILNKPFESVILPDRDHVKRGESYERTWSWMTIGNLTLKTGSDRIVVKLLNKKNDNAGLIKAVRFVKL